MASGPSVFFNTKIVNNRCCLESTGNALLSPVRTLFGGRTVVHVDGHFIVPPKRQHSTFVKIIRVALAVVFLVPGVILGVCVKGLAMLRKSIRKSHRDFKQLDNGKTADQNFITDKNGIYLLLGDRSTLKPSIDSYKNQYPWVYLDKTIKEPTALHLQNMNVEHIERLLKLTEMNHNSVTMVDLRGLSPTDELLDLLIEKCPNMQILHITDFSRVSFPKIEGILKDCVHLDELSKNSLESLLNPKDREEGEGEGLMIEPNDHEISVEEMIAPTVDRVTPLGINAATEMLDCSKIANLDSGLFSEIIERCGETLTSLNLSGCKFLTSEDLELVFTKCLQLENLNLFNVSLSEADLNSIDNLSKLRVLDLSSTLNTLSLDLCKKLALYPHLNELALNNFKELKDGDVCAVIDKLKKLTYLSLTGCSKITKVVLEHIGEKCLQIQSLSITGTKITEEESQAFMEKYERTTDL